MVDKMKSAVLVSVRNERTYFFSFFSSPFLLCTSHLIISCNHFNGTSFTASPLSWMSSTLHDSISLRIPFFWECWIPQLLASEVHLSSLSIYFFSFSVAMRFLSCTEFAFSLQFSRWLNSPSLPLLCSHTRCQRSEYFFPLTIFAVDCHEKHISPVK